MRRLVAAGWLWLWSEQFTWAEAWRVSGVWQQRQSGRYRVERRAVLSELHKPLGR